MASIRGMGEEERWRVTVRPRARNLQRGMDRFKTGDRRPGRRRLLIDTSPLIITSFPASRVAARTRARDKSSRLVPTRERECYREGLLERKRERRREKERTEATGNKSEGRSG